MYILYIHEQFLPASKVCIKTTIDVSRLHIPKTLVLKPHLE